MSGGEWNSKGREEGGSMDSAGSRIRRRRRIRGKSERRHSQPGASISTTATTQHARREVRALTIRQLLLASGGDADAAGPRQQAARVARLSALAGGQPSAGRAERHGHRQYQRQQMQLHRQAQPLHLHVCFTRALIDPASLASAPSAQQPTCALLSPIKRAATSRACHSIGNEQP